MLKDPRLLKLSHLQVAPRISSGILAAAWQQLQVQTQMVRKQRRAMEEVRKIMEVWQMSPEFCAIVGVRKFQQIL